MFTRHRWILLALFLLLAACSTALSVNLVPSPHEVNPPFPSDELIVHYIDVDQGDATLLQSSEFTMLIDAGRHDRDDVVPYLKSVGIEKIDILVGTHPHADHIGQMDKVLEQFPVEEVWMSGDAHTSKTFERVLDAIIESGAHYVEPRAGEKYALGSAEITVLHPDQLTGDLNGGSIAMHIQFGEVTFLFTGDAEAQQEAIMMASGLPLKAHLFQLGHHGSSTSNTQPFLDNIRPDVTIYSAGAGNSYGHPHDEVMDRLEKMGIPVFGTDVHGTIIVRTDGTTYYLSTSENGGE